MIAVIAYYSHKGKTANYARDMAMYLWSKGVSVRLSSISDFNREKLADADMLLLGCWTSGWFFFNQHPHKHWVEFAKTLRDSDISGRLLLFSTYKIRTGSMFRRMEKALGVKSRTIRLQSKTGFLSTEDKQAIDSYLARLKLTTKNKNYGE